MNSLDKEIAHADRVWRAHGQGLLDVGVIWTPILQHLFNVKEDLESQRRHARKSKRSCKS